MSKRLSDIISGLDFLDIQGNIEQSVSGLSYDSRECKPGYLFFALPGIHTDGKQYIRRAVQHGAIGVVYEGSLDQGAGEPSPWTGAKTRSENIAFLRVADCRWAMSAISGKFYDDPSDSLCVIGVTGTEGKSTTVSLIYQLLQFAGYRAGFFSTVTSDTGDGERPNPQHQTTPESTAVRKCLQKCVIVASLSPWSRHRATAFRPGPPAWRMSTSTSGLSPTSRTNTSSSMAHGNSTAATKPTSFAVWEKPGQNGWHVQMHAFLWASSAPTIERGLFCRRIRSPMSYLFKQGQLADLCARDIEATRRLEFHDRRSVRYCPAQGAAPHAEARGPRGTYRATHFRRGSTCGHLQCSKRPWRHLAPPQPRGCIGAVSCLLAKLRPVKGRMQRISEGQPFDVIIDYAHTPSSFKKDLPPLAGKEKAKFSVSLARGGRETGRSAPNRGVSPRQLRYRHSG